MSDTPGKEQPGGTASRIADHEMVRRIGRGSYGEVWLARSVTGSYRAVKILRRCDFDHDRPYEREFAGLLKFEPISRSSESQIHVLHVGRDDAAGLFFYVMELADDQKRGQSIGPAEYAPRTLRSDLYTQGRLPAAECVEVGLRLVQALKHLHAQGLVHRDVKPSNIVFVNGVPKLADIGLVTGAGDAKSALGTEGYVPQEGIGSPQADLYALGKVLYEASTGRDRLDYPELPTALRDFSDRAQLLELNEVILKACSEDRAQRFQSAVEMEQALLAVRDGRMQPTEAAAAKNRLRPLALMGGAVAVVACCLWFALPRLGGNPQRGLHYLRNLEIPEISDWSGGRFGDLDGNGYLDVLVASSNRLFVVASDGRELARSEELEEPGDSVVVSALEDLDQDGRDEVFVNWREGTNLYTGVLNQRLEAIQRFQFTGTMLSSAQGELLPDSNLTGVTLLGKPPKLIGCIITGYALNPRGVVCMDFNSGKLLWQYFTAPSADRLVTVDIDGDGRQEIVAGSYSVANGNQLPDGTDDRHCYLYALKETGEPLWRREMGGEYTACTPFTGPAQARSSKKASALFTKQNENDPLQLYVAVCRGVGGERGEVWKVDSKGEPQEHYDAKARLLSWTATRDREGRGTEVLLTDCAGRLHVLDAGLGTNRVVQLVQKRFDFATLNLDAVCDLDKDGKSELVLHSSQERYLDPETETNRRIVTTDCRVWVLDSNLEVLDQITLPAPSTISSRMTVAVNVLGGSRGAEIIVLGEKATVLQWSR